MSILFSQVESFSNGDSIKFLASGIPRTYDDLEKYTDFEEFTDLITENCEVLILVNAYLYGDGEMNEASEDELENLNKQIKLNPEFLNNDDIDKIENLNFSFDWNVSELFGMNMEK